MYGMNGVRSLKPGPLTLTWEESIAHVGSPFRLAILDEHEKVKVVLADHIPHNDAAKSSFLERTYTPYHLTVEIPDVECEKCTLQLIYFMTDKTVKCGSLFCTYHADDSACSGHIDAAQPTCFGAPNDVPCKEKDSCFSNYHTCTDVSIAGTRAIEEFDLDLQVGMGGREGGFMCECVPFWVIILSFLPAQILLCVHSFLTHIRPSLRPSLPPSSPWTGPTRI